MRLHLPLVRIAIIGRDHLTAVIQLSVLGQWISWVVDHFGTKVSVWTRYEMRGIRPLVGALSG